MIIDPEIERNIGVSFKAYRRLSTPLTDEDNEKFFTSYEVIKELEREEYEDKLILKQLYR
jgi:hypothetical protein